MMGCHICDIIAGKSKAGIIYQDNDIIAFISDTPSVVGHIILAPKRHSPIFESIDDASLAKLCGMANRLSAAVFGAVGAKGTNLLISNGTAAGQEFPHFCMNIIARQDGDGLIFDWLPKQLSEEEMAAVELQLKEGLTRTPMKEEPSHEGSAPPAADSDSAKVKEDGKKNGAQATDPEKKKSENSEESYLIKQLRRMP